MSNPKNKKFVGLLECPLRAGFIEFDYSPGDRVSELKEKAMEVWGKPIDVVINSPRLSSLIGGFDIPSIPWIILCEDEVGAYVPLKNNDEIPLKPPPAASEVIKQEMSGYFERRSPALTGVIYTHSYRILYAHSHQDDEFLAEILGIPNAHLEKEIHRQYTIPKEREYSIKLIALIAITGG